MRNPNLPDAINYPAPQLGPKVAFLTPTLGDGGAERWVATLATHLPRFNIDVIAIGLREPNSTAPAILERLPNSVAIYHGPKTWPALATEADFVIAWGLPDLTPIANTRARVIFVGHGHCEWSVRCIADARPQFHHAAAVSQHAADSFPGDLPVTIIHNGIDDDRCTPTKTRTEQRAEWHVDNKTKVIGYVGRLSPEKRPLTHILPTKLLGRHYRPLLCGGGPMADTFRRRARAYHHQTITLEPVTNVGNIYHALDCFVLASEHEGFSLALAEAWYCGCPTVATPVGATELTRRHGPLTIPIPINPTAMQLADAITAATHPHNRHTIDRAQRAVRDHYLARHMAARWAHYLLRLRRPTP